MTFHYIHKLDIRNDWVLWNVFGGWKLTCCCETPHHLEVIVCHVAVNLTMLESFISWFGKCSSRTANCFLSFFISDGTFFWLHSMSTSACVPVCPEHQFTFCEVLAVTFACVGYTLNVENIKGDQKEKQ